MKKVIQKLPFKLRRSIVDWVCNTLGLSPLIPSNTLPFNRHVFACGRIQSDITTSIETTEREVSIIKKKLKENLAKKVVNGGLIKFDTMIESDRKYILATLYVYWRTQ